MHRIEGGPSPNLHGPETHLVHLFGDGDHVLRAHPGGVDGLMSIAQRVVLDLNGIDRSILHNV